MRLLAIALIFAGSGAIAQSPTGFGRLINPSGIPPSRAGAGFGRLIYPGTGGPPMVRRPGFPPALRTFRAPNISHPFHGNTIIVPYPVFYGGGYYGYDAPPAPLQGSDYDSGYSAQQPSPVVVLNQNFRPDVNQAPGYGAPPPPPPPSDQSQESAAAAADTSQILFLIAMKDHTIFPALAYWVEGDTLNYITNQGVRNRVSLDLVDRDFSKQLNQQRGVDFALPDTK
ncbi:MAG TPA: hypothetical protein VH639_12470 [Bryobacteraceae bacterium]|jgi:hypothetical protein